MNPGSCKVLVIDDSADHQILYKRMLGRATGTLFTVVSAANASAGLLASRRECPDCILLDLNLPDVGGLALLESLRESLGQLPCAIVIVTACGSESAAVDAMKRGAQDYLVKGQIDAAILCEAITKAVENVSTQKQREADQARMHQMALHDSLTGLANRRNFEPRVVHALDLARRTDSSVALLAMDLDGFKVLNDELGHHAGDQALRQVAQRLKTVLRVSDTLARLGGDEFALLMESQPTRRGALVVANKILEAIRAPMRLENRSMQVSVSIGIAHSTVDVDAATLLRRADSAMYLAKRSGCRIAEFSDKKVARPTPPSGYRVAPVWASVAHGKAA